MKLRPLLFAAVLLGPACDDFSDTIPTAPTNVTTIVAKANYTFTPPWTSVPVGSTVTFQFEGVAHSPTFSAILGAPASIPSTANASVTRTFPSKGVFNYTCALHSFMTGRITVE
jgi:plastocyanin